MDIKSDKGIIFALVSAIIGLSGCSVEPMPEPIPIPTPLPPPPPPPLVQPVNSECCRPVIQRLPANYSPWSAATTGYHSSPVESQQARGEVAISASRRATSSSIRSPICNIQGKLRPDFDRAVCDAISLQIRNGCFAFKPNEQMTLNQPATVNASLAEEGDCAAAELRVGKAGGVRTAIVKIATYTFARLTSNEPSLKIVAKSEELVDLVKRPEPDWIWEVTPTKATDKNQTFLLTLETGVKVRFPDGTVREVGMSPIPPANIRVIVPPTVVGESIVSWLIARFGSLGALVAEISTFLGSLAALRIAWRKFVRPAPEGAT